MKHDAVTYFVGSELPSISVQNLSDLHEVLDLVWWAPTSWNWRSYGTWSTT